MQTHSDLQTQRTKEPSTKGQGGIVYRTVCQNSGCTHTFDLRITPENASLLSGTVACPRCRRHGGMLKPQGRLGDRLFSAKLVYRLTGIGPRPDEDDAYTETTEIRY
ncbi:MAG: hypothetical protein ACREQT_13275 [Candidatus Binataceae bacterium]